MTDLQSNAASGRSHRVPSADQLPPLVARSPLAVFDEAFTFLRIRPSLFLAIAAVGLIPARLVALLVPGDAVASSRPDEFTDVLIDNLARPGVVAESVVTIVLESLALFLVASAYAEIAAAWFSGRAPTSRELLTNSAKRLPKVFVTWVMVKILMIAAGVVSVGVGALLVGTLFALTAPITGAEQTTLWAAARRSSHLVTSKLGQTFLVFVCTGLGAIVIRFAIKQAPAFVFQQLFLGQLPLPDWLIVGVFDVVGSTLALAFVAAASVVLYLDLRVRREGIDLGLAIHDAFPSGGLNG